MNHPDISNLNDFLTKLSACLTCLIVIDNFKLVNFNQLQIPIVIRTPEAIVRRIPF